MPPNTGAAQVRGRWEQGEDSAPVPAMGICHPLAGFILEEPLGNELLLHIPALGGSGISREQPGCLTTCQKLEKMEIEVIVFPLRIDAYVQSRCRR